MPAPTEEHLIDTNVTIECHRTGSWKALAADFTLATVDKVIEECATGGGRRDGYVSVDVETVRQQILVYTVTEKQLADLRLRLAGRVNLDPGEEHLLAQATTEQQPWRICSPDTALIRACRILNCLDRVVSLESLLTQIAFRTKIPLQRQYTANWLSEKKTDLLLECA
jgi:predicted nucleic acid-binding protein